MRDGESGQMMLLAAVVLILGFVALTGLVARVNQLPPAIAREQSDPIFLEVDPMAETVDRMVGPQGLEAQGVIPGETPDPLLPSPWQTALTQALAHLAALEAGKGFIYRATICWIDDGDSVQEAGEGRVVSEISDDSTLLIVRSTPFTAVALVGISACP